MNISRLRRMCRSLVAGFALVGAASALATAGQAASIEERLVELEKRVASLAAENVSLKRELGFAKDGGAPVLVRQAGKETRLALGGFIQAHAEFGDAPDARYAGVRDRILLRRARLNVTGTFAEHVLAKIEGDFGSNSIGNTSGARGQLTDGFVQWSKFSQAGVRLGQFKTPFGHEQLSSDTRLFTIERALPSDRLTMSRQIGASVFGELAGKRVSYQAGLFNGNGVNTGADDNDSFLWAGRLAGVLIDGQGKKHPVRMTGGVNAFTSDETGALRGTRTGFGIDAQVTAGPAEVWAEYLRQKSAPRSGGNVVASGWSLLGAWRFDAHWQGVVRYETYESNADAADSTTDLWMIGANYFIRGDDLKLSVNYLLGSPAGATKDEGRLTGRMQVMF